MSGLRSWLLITAIVVGVGFTIWYFSELFGYIVAAWVLSLVLRPVYDIFTHLHIGKYRVNINIAAALTLLSFLMLLLLLASLFVPMILEQVRNFSTLDYYSIAKSWQRPINHFNAQLRVFGLLGELQTSPLSDFLRSTFKTFDPTNFLTNLVGTTAHSVVGLGVTLFITFFLVKDETIVTNVLLAMLPEKHAPKIRQTIAETTQMLMRYFIGLAVQWSFFTFFVSIGLWIIGVPNALLIGCLAGSLNLIPYIGPVIGLVVTLLLTLSANLDQEFLSVTLPALLKVVAVFWSTQFLDNFILNPYIFASSVKAHPLEIFLIILVGAQVGGVIGMVVATPIYTVGRIVARLFFGEYRFVQFMTNSMGAGGTVANTVPLISNKETTVADSHPPTSKALPQSQP